MRDGGDRSTSGKCLPKSSACVIDNGELFSLTLILIVLPETKKLRILLRLILAKVTPKQCLGAILISK